MAIHMAKHSINLGWQLPNGENLEIHEKSVPLMKTVLHDPIIIFPQDFDFFFFLNSIFLLEKKWLKFIHSIIMFIKHLIICASRVYILVVGQEKNMT